MQPWLHEPHHVGDGIGDKVMKQYGLPAAIAARILTELERELRTPLRSVTKRSLPRREPLPEHNSCALPKKPRITMSFTEAIELLKQMSELERWVHSAIGLIIAWLWFMSQIGHSLLVDLLIAWERLQ
jgi:hypothetical protein